MASAVDVCNMALIALGQPTIVQIDPPDVGSKSARICAQVLPMVRDDVQRAFPWKRLKARIEIPADGFKPAFGWTAQYVMPEDALFITEVLTGGCPVEEWEVEGVYILTDTTGPLQVKYVKKSEDVSQWDASMAMLLSMRLALELAETFTQEAGKKNHMYGRYDEALKDARRLDSREGLPKPMSPENTWVQVRSGGRG